MAYYLLAGEDSLSVSVDPQLKIVAARVKWMAPNALTAINGAMPLLHADGSDENWLSALVENRPRTLTRGRAGNAQGYIVTSTLEGLMNPSDAGAEEFELQGTTSEDKVEALETFDIVYDVYQGYMENGRVKFPQKIDDQRNPAYGFENFLNPGLVWTRSWTAESLDRGLIERLGKIDAPPGNPPELSGNRNWLLVRLTGKRRGNIWKWGASWMMSGPYGWLPEAYSPR